MERQLRPRKTHQTEDEGLRSSIVASFSDDSEDLPASLMHRNQNPLHQEGPSVEPVTKASSSSLTIFSLLEKYQVDEKRDAQKEELLQQLHQLTTKEGHGGTVCGDDKLNLDALLVRENTICNSHKGEPILDLNQQCCLFGAETLDLKDYPSTKTKVDRFLKNSSVEDLLMFTETGGLRAHFSRVTNKEEVVRYVFRLLNVHSDQSIVQACRKFLNEVLEIYPDTANCFDLKEFITAVVNLGATLDRLFPEPDLQSSVKTMFNIPSNVTTKPTKTVNHQAVENLLHIVVNVLHKSTVWNNDNLTVLLVMVCALVLDCHFTTVWFAAADAQLCISKIVTLFDATKWPQTVSTLSRQICSLSRDHHNLVFLVGLLLGNTDCIESLRKVTAFRAIHKILNQSLPADDLADVSPEDVVRILNGCTLRNTVDLYMWFSILNLMNWCISNNVNSISNKHLDELHQALRRLISTLKDDVSHTDANAVKDLAMRIETKWVMMKEAIPYSQKTIFGYFKTKNSETESQSSESQNFVDNSL